jgi:hypothetical protein
LATSGAEVNVGNPNRAWSSRAGHSAHVRPWSVTCIA